MPVPAFQFQQLCQIPAMSVENTISTQKDPAAICKLSLILKKRLRRLIALSCLILLCPAESQHSREWQLYETPELAALVKKPALSLIMQLNNNNNWINDNAVVPPWMWLGLVITLQGTHEKVDCPQCRDPGTLLELLLHTQQGASTQVNFLLEAVFTGELWSL